MVGKRFSPGDEVEVRSDDEGFRGAWYEAKIVRFMPKGHRYSVVYDSLLSDGDDSQPLRENVNRSYVRPRPPRRGVSGGQFRLHQPVDARHNEGWWVGVVAAVKSGEEKKEERYTVCFPNTREVMEFGPSDLRDHLDWVDGEWVAPHQKGTAEMAFVTGTQVEVTRYTGNSLSAWFVATVVKPVWKNNLLVEYQSLRADDGAEFLKEIVDSQHIRPRPPLLMEVRHFDLLDEVEAFHNDGWCAGVISKILTGSRYFVNSKHWEEDIEVCEPDVRFRHEWIDGRWVRASKKLDGTKSVGHKQLSHTRNIAPKANVPIYITAYSDSQNKALNSNNEMETRSTFQGQIGLSLSRKKSKKRDPIEDDRQLFDSLMMARGAKAPSWVEREFGVATPMIGEIGKSSYIRSLMDEQYDSKILLKRKYTKSLNTDSKLHSNPSSIVFDSGPASSAIFSQKPLVQLAPVGITELSISGGEHTNIEGEGSEHQSKGSNHHPLSISHEINNAHLTDEWGQRGDVQSSRMNSPARNRKVAAQSPKHRRKVPYDVVMRQHTGEKKRGRGRHAKAIIINMEASLEGPELKQSGEMNDAAVGNELTTEGDERTVKGVSADVSCRNPQFCLGNGAVSVAAEVKNLTDEIERSVMGTKGDTSRGILLICDRDNGLSAVSEADQLKEEVQSAIIDVLVDIPYGMKTVLHEDKTLDCEYPRSITEDKGVNALDFHWANEKLVDKEAVKPSNERYIMCQLEPAIEGDTSIKDLAAKKLLDVTVSSDTRLKEIPEFDIHLSGAARVERNEALQQPLGGQVSKRLVTEKEWAITDPIASGSCSKNLLFVKSSSMWESIEAMEIFRAMPQQPHFHPLQQYCEEFREGMAIGLMVTFANLVSNTSKLRIVDPRATFEERLKTLDHLEGHGFNVQCVQGRLEQLIRIKDNQGQFVDKRAELEGLILERQKEEWRLTTNIDIIDRSLAQLEESVAIFRERRASIAREKENNDSEIVRLQMDVKAVTQAHVFAEHDFDSVLAAAW